MSACTLTSSADSGSSSTSTSGSTDNALAIPIRWRWPPENSCGYASARCGSSCTVRISSGTLASASFWFMPWTIIGSAIVCLIRRRGCSEEYGSWKTICSSLRSLRSSAWLLPTRSSPL